MKITKQILRQPLKSLLGALSIVLAAAILCVCIGQSVVAARTAEAIDNRYVTVALPTLDAIRADVQFDGSPLMLHHGRLSPTVTGFIEELIHDHPEIIKAAENPGLASAYIPELTADNESHYQYQKSPGQVEALYSTFQKTIPTYAYGIFEIVITKIEDPKDVSFHGKAEDGTEVSLHRYTTVSITGTIENVLSLECGYADPTGYTASIALQLPDAESLEAMDLEVGGRYLVYGSDYQDGNWRLASEIALQLQEKDILVDYRDINTDDICSKISTGVGFIKETRYYYPYEKTTVWLTATQMQWHDTVTITVQDAACFGTAHWVTHENGKYATIDYNRYITDENGNQVQVSEEEWQSRYSVPTMARLDGSVEEFLASEAGAIWQRQLEYMEINQHAFPIIGVNNLNYLANFAQGDARIVDGREFTEAELSGGSKVCIISETLAQINGLSVGDTISPQFYNYDHNDPNQEFLSDYEGTLNPWAYKFTGNTPFAGEAEAYTIVGIYRQSNAWGNVADNLSSFTPNTIFVPHSSVSSDMDYCDQGFFQTVVLHNDALEAFQALLIQEDYGNFFVFHDQGYSLVSDMPPLYRQIAQRSMVIGLAAWGVLMLLFMLLFPGSQGKAMRTMTALGATRGKRMAHILLSAAGILIPGTVIGLGAGYLLWDKVAAWVAKNAGSVLNLEMDAGVLALIALAQLAAALVLTALLAIPLSRHRGIKRRR